MSVGRCAQKTAAALTAHFGSYSHCVLPWSLVFISLLFEMISSLISQEWTVCDLCCSNGRHRGLFAFVKRFVKLLEVEMF